MKFQIENEKLSIQIQRELDAYTGFQRNIQVALKNFADHPNNTDAHDFAEQVRFNQQMASLYLERAAAALELVGLFDEEQGDCIDFKTINLKLHVLKTFHE